MKRILKIVGLLLLLIVLFVVAALSDAIDGLLARALRMAVARDARAGAAIPSTKGSL